MLAQMTKNLLVSNTLPSPNTSPHHDAKSWFPVSAWQTTMQFVFKAFSVPYVV